MLDRPATLDRWDSLAARRPVVGFAAHDAHGGWSRRAEDGGGRGIPGVPSYEASFRAFAIRAVLESEPTGAADRDARLLLAALRAGRVFTAIDAVAGPASVDFRAHASGGSGVMGQRLPFGPDARVTFRSTLPAGGRAVLLRDGKEVASSSSGELTATAPEPGAYRVEVSAAGAPGTPPVPWLVTNPIYLLAPESQIEVKPIEAVRVVNVDRPGVIEKDPASTAAITEGQGWQRVAYRLRAGDRVSQYVALAVPLSSVPADLNAVAFSARAAGPMRLSVQLRSNDLGGVRWARSMYLWRDPVRVILPVNRLVAVDSQSQPLRFASASSLLFVVDLTNARPGAEGQFDISDVAMLALQNPSAPIHVGPLFQKN